MDLEIHTIPVISTGHITSEVNARLLEDQGPWGACAILPHSGFFMFLDEVENDDEPVPQCILDIRDWLHGLEAAGRLDRSRWIRLESDGQLVDGLPTYDW